MSDYNNMEIRARRAEQRIRELQDELADAAGALQRAKDEIAALRRKYEPESVAQ